MHTAVGAYLDCGILDNGFARVRCSACQAEFLIAFSCKGRGLCPSCAAKRAAFLRDEVLAEVGHAQWAFSIPKMLRPYFHHRPLLGRLCRLAYRTAREMISAASPNGEPLSPGMIAVVQTSGDDLTWPPHVHALTAPWRFSVRRGWLLGRSRFDSFQRSEVSESSSHIRSLAEYSHPVENICPSFQRHSEVATMQTVK